MKIKVINLKAYSNYSTLVTGAMYQSFSVAPEYPQVIMEYVP